MSAAAISAGRLGGAPLPVAIAIAAAWALALAAEISGSAGSVHHDALLGSGLTAPAVALFLVAWQVMVAAMMVPSSLPLIVLFERASGQASQPGRVLGALIAGYALAWAAFGLAAFGMDAALHAGVDGWGWLGAREWAIGPATLALAGAFQFTPLKDRCLDQCRHPGAFLTRYYRRGTGAAFSLGARHGAFCVGCCWALMLVMFAVGVASLVWMALFTAVMVHEKTRPAGRRAVPATGAALLGVASVLLAWSAYANGVI
jgi:predicted metal-binding membrane protein